MINRMDIVHLIETKMNKMEEETSSHTYAEIEQTMALDHNEGFSALHEDMDSPRPSRCRDAAGRSSASGQEVPMVSAEELSFSLSSLHETSGQSTTTGLLRGAQRQKLHMEAETTQSSQTIYEEVTDSVHTGGYKQVSPFFSLYRTSPYKLRSHVTDPVFKGGPRLSAQIAPPSNPTVELCCTEGAAEPEGAEGGEDWSLECLQTAHSEDFSDHLSPSPWRDTFNSSRTGVCEDRPLSMTDFGDSLVEGDEAEQDFRELSMELTETNEVSGKDSIPEQTSVQQRGRRHEDQVSHRLYKVLYGDGAEAAGSCSEGVSALPVCSPSNDITQVVRRGGLLEAIPDRTQTLSSDDPDPLPNTNPNINVDLADSSDVGCKNLLLMVQKEEITTSDTFSTKCRAAEYEAVSESLACPDTVILLTESRASTPESVSSMNELHFLAPDSPVPQFRPLSPLPPPVLPSEPEHEGAETQTQQLLRAPEGNTCPCASEAEERSLTPMVSNRRPFGRPVSPGSDCCDEGSISPQSFSLDLENRALSPESVILETLSCFLTPDQCVSPDFHEIRTSSPESTKSITPCSRLPPDSPVQDFRRFAPDPVTCGFRPSSPESDLSNIELEMRELILFSEDRPASPDSAASVNECQALSADSPVPEFSPNLPNSPVLMTGERFSSPESACSDLDYDSLTPSSFNYENRALSPSSVPSGDESESVLSVGKYPARSTESFRFAKVALDSGDDREKSLIFDSENKPLTPADVPAEEDDDWVIIFSSDVEEKPLSLDSVSKSTLLDKSTHSAEVSSADEFKTETRHDLSNEERLNEDVHSPVSRSGCNKRKKSRKVKKHQKDVPLKTKEDTQSADKARSLPSSSPEPAPEGLRLSLTTSVSKEAAESSAVKRQHHTPLSLTEHPQPGFSLVYNAELWKFISPIRDPQYIGDTFISKVGQFQFCETLSGSCQGRSALQVEMCKQALPFDSEAENQPVMLLNPVLAQPSQSGSSAEKQQTLPPHSPISQSIASFSGLSKLSIRPESPELVSSDLEPETDLNVSHLFDDRPSSPDSGASVNADNGLSVDSPVPDFGTCLSESFTGAVSVRSSSFESVISDAEYGSVSLSSLLTENRLLSSDSVDGNRALSPESPILDFGRVVLDSTTLSTLEKSSSPVSFVSGTECRSVSTESLFGESRPPSVDSVDEDYPLLPESPVPEFRKVVRETKRTTLERSSSPVSVASDPESGSVSLDLLLCEDRPASIESAGENYPLPSESPIPDFRKVFSDSHALRAQTGVEKSSSPISLASDSEYRSASLESLYGESRPSSVDENGLLLPEPHIPDVGRVLLETHLSTVERLPSPASFVSDLDNEVWCQPACCSGKTLSPDLVLSGDDYQSDSPIPEFKAGFKESVSGFAHRLSSPESVISEGSQSADHEVDTSISNQRPDSPDLEVSEITERLLGSNRQSVEELSGTVSKHVCDPELRKLISQIRDPQYVGETFFSKTGFEFIATRTEFFSEVADMTEPEDNMKLNSTESECGPLSLQEMTSLTGQRSGSPKTFKDLCLDSQVLWVSSDSTNISHFLQHSPQSAESDEESELCMFPDVSERPSSPSSAVSVDEMTALSPDSPTPDFRLGVSELIPGGSGYRSSSPESACSDTENGFSMPLVLTEQRPDSPESPVLSPEHDGPTLRTHQLICQLHDPQYVASFKNEESTTELVSFDSDVEKTRSMLLDSEAEHELLCPEKQQTLSPENIPDKKRPLSPDSPVSQFSVSPVSSSDIESLNECIQNKQSSPQSGSSETEMVPRSMSPQSVLMTELSSTMSMNVSPDSPLPSFDQNKDISLPSSPDSLESEDEHQDSSASQVTRITERFPSFVRFSSASHQSAPPNIKHASSMNLLCETQRRKNTSESEPELGYRLLSPDLESENRSSSPESVSSMLEHEVSWAVLYDDRPSSPDSLASASKTLAADSPIPDFRKVLPGCADISGCSPSTPEPIESDVEFAPMSQLSEDDERPNSPDSISSFQRMSTDSPIPQYTHHEPEAGTCRSTSPDSVYSDEGVETDGSIPCLFEVRSISPGSATSRNEFRPDSPIPEFTLNRLTVCHVDFMSISPESLFSGEDSDTDLCMTWLFGDRAESPGSTASNDELRPCSPDSPIPAFTKTQESSVSHFVSGSTSPESLSDLEMELYFSVEGPPASPESFRSPTEHLFVPPDSPVPDFRQALHDVCHELSVYRSSSPESVASDVEYAPLISQMYYYEDRVGSELSDSEVQGLSPDSPVPQYPMTEPTNVGATYRSTSPESVFSGEDSDTDLCTTWLFEDRAASPGSAASNDELRPCSPDSPISAFTQTQQESFVSHFVSRSPSPESEASEIEYAPLILQMYDYEDSAGSELSDSEVRGLSPDSPVPQYPMSEPINVGATYRSTSPESVFSGEDSDTDLCTTWLFEDRAASPGSAASNDELRPCSPDSPISAFTQILHESFVSHFVSRSPSPESEASEIEYAPLILQMYDYEDSAGSELSDSEVRGLSPDSPVPQYSILLSNILGTEYRSTSPESVFSGEDSDTDLCTTWLFEDRVASPGSAASNDELRPCSPDSPIPAFTQILHESFVSHFVSRSPSPESEASEIEYAPLVSQMYGFDDKTESCISELSDSDLRGLSPDSPVFDFRQALHDTCQNLSIYRSSSPESEASELEYAPLTSQMYDYEDSAGSELSDSEVRGLSPDSPLPQYCILSSNILGTEYRSTSPESVFSGEDSDTGLCIPWLFEDRAESPGSAASNGDFPFLSPDSPIPNFTLYESTMPHMDLRSTSPESVVSDLETDLPFITFTKSRPSSESVRSVRLSPDSPVPDFARPVFELHKPVFGRRSVSPDSTCSEVEYIVLSLGAFSYDNRPSSPGSASGDEYQALSPDSPVPDYTPAVCERVIINAGYRSPSPESVESDVEYALGELLISMGFGNRTDSNESLDLHYGPTLVDFIPEYQTMSLTNIRSESPESTRSLQDMRLSPDSPLPWFIQNVAESVENHNYSSSPVSQLSDIENDLVYFASMDKDVSDRSLSPQSDRSDHEYKSRAESPESVTSVSGFRPLSPDSPLPEFSVALPECVKVFRSTSSSPETQLSDIDDVDLCLLSDLVEFRPSSPEPALSKDQDERPLSSQSLPEYRPMSLESAMYAADRRASSPEPIAEFNQSRSLSPDSPIPQFSPAFEVYPTIQHYSSSAESLDLDSEDELIMLSAVDETSRPSSPESSISEFRWLLPDSPVPEFMRILSSYFMQPTPFDKSSSPVSVSSESEFVALPVDCWFDDSLRPASPESVESESECYVSEWLDSRHFHHDASGSLAKTKSKTVSPLLTQSAENKLECEHFNPDRRQESQLDIWTYEGQDNHGFESESCSRVPAVEFTEDLSQTPSPVKDVKREEEKMQPIPTEELKNKMSSSRVPAQETEAETYGDVMMPASPPAQGGRKVGGLFIYDEPVPSLPIQLPARSSYRTHRTVTPVLLTFEKSSYLESDVPQEYSDWDGSPEGPESSELLSPTSDQFLVPPDYEGIFSGDQTLRVSECRGASSDDLSPVSPVFFESSSGQPAAQDNRGSQTVEDFEFSPDFKRVLSDFEKTVLEFEMQDPNIQLKEPSKVSKSPELSDSDPEFFDCRQDLSEPDDVEEPEHLVAYQIFEPPSPKPTTPDVGTLKRSHEFAAQTFLQTGFHSRLSSGSESLGDFAYDSEASQEGVVHTCEELPSRDQAGYCDVDDSLGREIAEELGTLSSDSSEEEVLTTRVVRRRIIIQADNLPDIPPQTITEEKYTDEHGNMVVKKITRKVVRKYVSPDGSETQEVSVEGSQQETVQIEEGDSVSRVVKRTVLHTEGDQRELTFSEPLALGGTTASEFEAEPVQGRKVSKVVKMTMVRGERTEKLRGDPSLAADLPSAQEDFEKALSYAGGFGKFLLPHVVEKQVELDDGSLMKRSQMRKCRTQKRTVVRDARGKRVHLERLDDTPDALRPDALQQRLHQLLQRYCEEQEEEEQEQEETD